MNHPNMIHASTERPPFLEALSKIFLLPPIAPLAATQALAQDHTLVFSTTDPGLNSSITNWGLDTTWTDANNMQRGLIFMGTNNASIVRVGFLVNAQLTNNDISASQKATLDSMANVAAMAKPDALWNMCSDAGVGVP